MAVLQPIKRFFGSARYKIKVQTFQILTELGRNTVFISVLQNLHMQYIQFQMFHYDNSFYVKSKQAITGQKSGGRM